MQTFSTVLKRLGNHVVWTNNDDQIVLTKRGADSFDEWLERQGFSYEGAGHGNTHIYSRQGS